MVDRKRAWFNRGVAALSIAAPMAGGRVYRCPLCLRDFDKPDDLSFEHAPPDSQDGRAIVLTCIPCNRWAGHTLDAHVANRQKVDDFQKGKTPLKGRLEMSGNVVNADITWGKEEITFHVAHERNDPKQQRAMQEYLPTIDGRTAPGGRITVYLPRVDPWPEKASWLRAGYLVMFAAFGYRYILDSALDLARRQIREFNTDPVGWCAAMLEETAPQPQLIAIREPSHLRCMMVRYSRIVVRLPEPGDHGFYDRATQDVAKNPRVDFTGLLVPWPTEPVFAFDFHPPGRYLPG